MISTVLVRREQKKTLIQQQRSDSAYRPRALARGRGRGRQACSRAACRRRADPGSARRSSPTGEGTEGLRKRPPCFRLAYYQEFIDAAAAGDPDAQAELRDTTRRVETILADLAILRAAGELYLLIQPPALDDLKPDATTASGPGWPSSPAPRRQTLDGFPSATVAGSSSRRAAFCVALEQARANETEVDAILSASQRLLPCASSRCNQRAWVPSGSRKSWPDLDSRPDSASRSGRSKKRY